MTQISYICTITNDSHPEKNSQLVALKLEYAQEISKITGRQEEEFYCFNNPVNVVATDQNGVIIGFIAVGMVEQEKRVYVCHVFVVPSLRKQGVYKTMLARLIKFTQDIGFKNITAGVFKNNKVSKRTHLALGFKAVMDLYELPVAGENKNND